MEGTSYYIVHESAMPSVLKKVAEANRLLSSGEVRTVNEAVEKVGIARSSYYKFKDSVEEFHNNLPGSMLTIVCEVSDRAGILSDLLQTIARCGANILTIHQAIPADGTAVVSISMQMLENADVDVIRVPSAFGNLCDRELRTAAAGTQEKSPAMPALSEAGLYCIKKGCSRRFTRGM